MMIILSNGLAERKVTPLLPVYQLISMVLDRIGREVLWNYKVFEEMWEEFAIGSRMVW
ncbi:hypothetical protein [Rossellomorea marisflavi]|uniref:hypothetical protein n=1 Tax=Rossellomorea marisflavi TaxID=189381 RepID=UPI003562C887